MTVARLKILHLATHLNLGGITRYIQILGTEMAKRGHELMVVSSGGQGEEDLKKTGIRCWDYPIRTKSILHPKLYVALPSIARLVRQEKVDLIHAHSRVTQVLAYWVSRFTGIPFVSTAHGFYKARWGRRAFPCWGERVIAVSSLVADELENSHKVDSQKIRIIHNALDIEELEKRLLLHDQKSARALYDIPETAFVVGSISRLVRDKGHEFLVEAVSRLVSEIPEIVLLVIGDGREKYALRTLIGKKGLAAHTRMIPGVNDTTAALSAMDLFVHPATFREGFGLSIAEAMIAKKPVVATDIPAIHTIFKHGLNAILVPPKDAEALAAAIRQLAKDKNRAKAIAEAGYSLAHTLCRSDRQADEMEKVYLEVLGSWKKKKN